VAKKDNNVAAYANAVAQALTQGGESTKKAYAAAFAKASAAGGDQAAGLAQAVAVVSCQGGARAEAFAQVGSEVLLPDGPSNG
jgi:hypothetical protein